MGNANDLPKPTVFKFTVLVFCWGQGFTISWLLRKVGNVGPINWALAGMAVCCTHTVVDEIPLLKSGTYVQYHTSPTKLIDPLACSHFDRLGGPFGVQPCHPPWISSKRQMPTSLSRWGTVSHSCHHLTVSRGGSPQYSQPRLPHVGVVTAWSNSQGSVKGLNWSPLLVNDLLINNGGQWKEQTTTDFTSKRPRWFTLPEDWCWVFIPPATSSKTCLLGSWITQAQRSA